MTESVSAPVGDEQTIEISLTVNGAAHRVRAPVRRLLSDLLRHDLHLVGTHVGCEHGVCGACTVLLDGAPVRSCLLLAPTVDGASITTIEGLADGDRLSPVQQAFRECHALQCGFCTPGFLTTVTAYLEQEPNPTPAQARTAIAGNLCRCTGYQNIVSAVLRAAELTAAEQNTAEPNAAEPNQADSKAAEPNPTEPNSAEPTVAELGTDR